VNVIRYVVALLCRKPPLNVADEFALQIVRDDGGSGCCTGIAPVRAAARSALGAA
jgi:hypothetical protein